MTTRLPTPSACMTRSSVPSSLCLLKNAMRVLSGCQNGFNTVLWDFEFLSGFKLITRLIPRTRARERPSGESWPK